MVAGSKSKGEESFSANATAGETAGPRLLRQTSSRPCPSPFIPMRLRRTDLAMALVRPLHVKAEGAWEDEGP